ncbi:MAG: carboxypeptidase regulatory-like domain-containing protein [Candidatus Aminicenantes bacterium]|nr:carboxypeptidase regulatory-like domain-containing protein [Candidatus Aminicenantes bacterium]
MCISKRTKEIIISVLLLWVFTGFCFSRPAAQESESIAVGEITVKGASLKIDPARQSVPVNTETAVNTVFSVDSADNAGMLQGMLVKGTLRGPGINGPITLATLPNHPFAIPGFPVKGAYTLEDVRLERNGVILAAAEPAQAVIDVMDIVVTRVETRPLTLEEIREKGIVISQDNFSVYNFSVGFLVNSQTVTLEFPMVYSGGNVSIPSGVGGGSGLGHSVPGREPVPILFQLPELQSDSSGSEQGSAEKTISGVVIFNNDIAFLNQFFSVMFIVSNHAPDGSNLALKDLTAKITFPDGLREAQTNPPHILGAAIPVRCPGPDGKIGTADDLDIILATFSGMAEFLAEGLKEGTHIVGIDFAGTLTGLPSGDTRLSGKASGAVIVRNPKFSVTFSHPSVIREGEEYDIYVTMTNTSPVAANLVSLTMPAGRLIGTGLLSDETVSFETIAPAESGTAKFHMIAKETGQVRASAFAADNGVSGKFVLTAGVGEKGIPLSPDTLVLPQCAYSLPNDLINASLMLLGEAHGIATTPAGGLPQGLPYISQDTVKERAVEFAEAGQRLEYGESLINTLEVLTLDWLGSRMQEINFDILRRLTSKGITLAREQAKIFNGELKTGSAVQFQQTFTENCAYKPPFFSALLSFNGDNGGGGGRNAYLRITDYYQNKLSDEDPQLIRKVPYGEFYLMNDGAGNPVDFALIGSLDAKNPIYTVQILGQAEGSFDLSLIVPTTGGVGGLGGGFRQVVFPGVSSAPGSVSTITVNINAPGPDFTLATDLNNDGQAETQTNGNAASIQAPALQLIGAAQDCGVDDAGHVTALFFNRPVDTETAKDKTNYFIEGKKIYAAYRQPSGRVVLIGSDNPISPFVESRVRVENLKDAAGGPLTPSPVEVPIKATIKTPGGVVYGQVLTADGQPVTGANMQLTEVNNGEATRSFSRTDLSGNYQFDFVRILATPFKIEVMDPTTGKSESVGARIMTHGQRLRIDIVMRGRGGVKGRVFKTDGTPVSKAVVSARAENSPGGEYYQAVANDAGEFFIADLPLGNINLYAASGGMRGAAVTSISSPGQIQEVDITVTAAKTASVSGRVLKSDGVTPAAEAYLNFYGANYYQNSTQSDENGFFQFSPVPVGGFSIDAYNPLTGSVGGHVAGQLVENQVFNAAIIFRGTGRVSGVVKNYDGSLQAGILVYLVNTSFYMNTGADGTFDFPGVPVGSYSVMAASRTLNVTTSAAVKIIAEGQQVNTALVFPDNRKGSIAGTVYNVDGVTPVSYTPVYVCDGNYIVRGTAQTNSNGQFQVSNLSTGSYMVFLERDGLAGIANTAVQFPGHMAQCNVKLRGKGKVIIDVFAPDGQTGIMADVQFNRLAFQMEQGDMIGFCGQEDQYTTGESGRLEIADVFMGDFSVVAQNPFYPRGASYRGKITAQGQEVKVKLVMRPTGKVTGKVVSYDGVTGVPGARVELKAGLLPAQALNAGANGEFEFTLVPPGYFEVKAEDTVTGFKGNLAGNIGEDGDTVDVTVRLLGRGQVNGTVKNKSEEFIANAAVMLKNIGFPDETFEATADGNGHFTIYNVSEGSFSVTAFDPVTRLGGRAQGKVPGHNAQVEVNVYIDPSGTVAGKILSPDGTTVMANVQVVLNHSRFGDLPIGYYYTGETGGYEFERVPSGSFVLEAYHPASGRKGKAWGTLVNEGQVLEKDISLEGRGTVTGTVFDGSRVNPVANAPIKIKSSGLYPFELVSNTDADGNYKFPQVAQGSFALEATDPAAGLIGNASGKVEYDGQAVYCNVYTQGTGSVKGAVFKADGLTPSANARIEVKSGGKTVSAYADASGNYRVDGVPLGSFSVSAFQQPGRDYGTASGKLDFHGQETGVNVSFKGLGSVAGRVLDGGGNPAPGITVTVHSGVEIFSTASGGSGAYRFDALRMGDFSLEAKDPVTRLSGTASGELTGDGQEATVDLTLEPAGSIDGRILNSDGVTPALNAYLKLKGSNYTQYYNTGSGGEFQFNAVKLGDFTLEVLGYNLSGKARAAGRVNNHGDTVNLNDMVLDNIKPAVSGFTPADGSGPVPLTTTVNVQFSEAMRASTISTSTIKLSSAQGSVAGSAALSGDLQSAVFTPSAPLSSFVLYTLTVDGAVEDAAGNALETAASASFTTCDIQPPTVVSIAPANNATGVPTTAAISVTFNEPIDPGNFSASNLVVKKAGIPINGVITFNENKLCAILTPAVLEANSAYSVTVQGARDFSGNVQAASFNSVFSTIDTIAPTVQLVPPAQGLSVIEGSTVQVSANISGATDVSTVYFFINGELKYMDKTSPYSYQFTAPSISQTNGGTFLLEALAVDVAGNQGNRANLTFTLLADTPPQATLTGPTNTTVYPGGTISCSVSASDDIRLTRATLTAVGGVLNYTNTQTLSQVSFAKNYTISIPANILPGTEIQVHAEVEDSRGNVVSAPNITLHVPQDQQNPAVSVTAPMEGARFKHNEVVNIAAQASDDVGLKEVRLYLDGQLLATRTQAPYTAVYTVPPLDNDKTVMVEAEAEDLMGKISESVVNIVLEQLVDITAPKVKIVNPANGSLVFAGENLKIKVEATDDQEVVKVEIYVDNQLINTITQSPYETTYTIPADAAAGSSIAIKAVATDVDNKSGNAQATVNVTAGTVIPAGTVIEAANTTYDNQTVIINSGTVTINGAHTFLNVLVKESGVLMHSAATSSKINIMQLTITGKLAIGLDAKISVNARGYLGGYQGDNTNNYGRTLGNTTSGGSNLDSGGSYGGYGGKYGSYAVNHVYGSLYSPLDLGSGGGAYGSSNPGGSGGGVIMIEAGEVINDGGIYANGGGVIYGGGGSGGSIQLHMTTLKGSGTITANGGNSSNYAAGGGGRIAIYYENTAEFNLANITAYGGKYTNGNDYIKNGSAGSVYLEQTGQEAQLIIDNNGAQSGNPLVFPAVGPAVITGLSANVLTDSNASYMPGSLKGMKVIPNINKKEKTFTIINNTATTIITDPAEGDLTTAAAAGDTYGGMGIFDGHLKIQNTYIAEIDGGARLGNLSVSGNTRLCHPVGTSNKSYFLFLKVAGTITLDSTSCITVSARGYLGGYSGDNNSNYGRTLGNTISGGSNLDSGGSHGGCGGKYATYAVNEVYGSLYLPSDPGSGGGAYGSSNPGGSGGGVIMIEAGEVVNDGGIYAIGGSVVYGGGGSGGSIQLHVTTLKGSGAIAANGGNSSNYAGGGGGRIALYYENASEFDLAKITAYGGKYTNGTNANYNAGAGTIYQEKKGQTGEIIIDNNDTDSTNGTPLPGGKAGEITALEAHKLTDANADFTPGSLVGMLLIPNLQRADHFTIIANTKTEIFTDPADGDMTTAAAVKDHYGFKFPGSYILDSSQASMNGSFSIPDMTLINASLTINGSLEVDRLTLQNGSVINHSPATTSTVYSLQIKAGEMVIKDNSSISANGRGYLGGYQGDNNSNYGRTLGNTTGGGSNLDSGGSYGGYGGKYSSYAVNHVYGSLYLPSDPGSGGGAYSSTNPGGCGGGVIDIEVGELLLEGGIYSNGGGVIYGGGGSGGSIQLHVTTLKGSGTITANGGNCSNYAGGGGGRIAIYYENASEFNLANVTAYGGKYTNGNNSNYNGSAGTIYLNQANQEAQLVINNNGTQSGNPLVFPAVGPSSITGLSANVLTDSSASYMPGSLKGMKVIPNINKKEKTFTIIDNTATTIITDPAEGDLTTATAVGDTYGGMGVFDGHLRIQNTYIAEINGGARLGNLSVSGNTRLCHPINTSTKSYFLYLRVTDTITVDSTSFITVSARGYLGGYLGDNNSNYGRTLGNTTSGGSNLDSGGSYGGCGGKYSTYAVNEVYGSLYLPSDPGSGGGAYSSSYPGGSGGGVIDIGAGELLLEGGIYANGVGVTYGGGGSGGSIQLHVTTLKGSGTITANGGNSNNYAGGGGGRIALYYETASEFDLAKITTYGGKYINGSNANYNAGAGTIYLKSSSAAFGDLIVNNNGTLTGTNSTTLPAVGQGFNTLLEPNRLVVSAAAYKPGSLVGLKLNPQPLGNTVFTILSNTGTDIFTNPADGDMTLQGTTGGPYIGEHFLFNLTVKGNGKLFTTDRVQVSGTQTVETGSTFKAENHQ